MENEIITPFCDYCKAIILDGLADFIGETMYIGDLWDALTKEININGSCTFSSYLAKECIKSWWDDAGDYWDLEMDFYGEHLWNPFDEPERFMVCMVIEGVRAILSRTNYFLRHFDEKIELTQEIVDKLSAQVEAFNDERILLNSV